MRYRDECKRIFDEYASKALKAQSAAESLKRELHAVCPELKEIDGALSECSLKLFAESLKGGGDLAERIEKIKSENAILQEKRKKCLSVHSLPEDITEPKYECKNCNDSGYAGGKMCGCLKGRLTTARIEYSGIGQLIRTQSFESFNVNYQSADKIAFAETKRIYDRCLSYANTFGGEDKNKDNRNDSLLFMGKTGLGKTHLSTSIAKRVIERGFEVVYDTASNIMSDFEAVHFKNGERGMTDKYFECDLLIIDDLGTEMQTSFTLSTLYNIINTRINRAKGTIINTNLTRDELRKRYEERITSRLFGEYKPILFKGGDVRMLKLKNENYD